MPKELQLQYYQKLRFIIPGIPMAKQSMRIGVIKTKDGRTRGSAFTSSKHRKEFARIRSHIQTQLPIGHVLLEGPLRIISLRYTFPPVTTLRKAQRDHIEAGGKVYKFTKPDLLDNLSKLVFDAMEGLVYKNDSQFCQAVGLEKVYGKDPGIEIEFETISNINIPLRR